MLPPVTRAVILARGLGTRMRREDAGAEVDPDQARVADRGLKAMIPVGRPFLDFVLSALADALVRDACLVIGPEHTVVREHYDGPGRPTRIRVTYAIQERPLGTADAVLAAESFAAGDRVLVLNGDNYYPAEVFRAVMRCSGSAVAGFEREALVRESNIPPERVRRFALLTRGPDGSLERIVEKPDPETFAAMGPDALVSMNCWLFTPAIFAACRRVTPSPRGELELQDAVRIAMNDLCERIDVVPLRCGVLDLSSRGDIADVGARLAGIAVRP